MTMKEFESELLKLASVTSITYARDLKGKIFKLAAVYVHTGLGQYHLEMEPDCMKNQLAYFENLRKKES